MAKGRKKGEGIAAIYSGWKKNLAGSESGEDYRKAAAELQKFGSEGERYIRQKLEEARSEELRFLLKIAEFVDSPEIAEGLRYVIQNGTVPLALKSECFELMAKEGGSLDSIFLKQLQEAEELYFQISSLLSKEDDESLERALSLTGDFLDMPGALKVSFLLGLYEEWGVRAVPFFSSVSERDDEFDALTVELVGDEENPQVLDFLSRVAEKSENKEAVKQARRALYRLQQKGVSPEKKVEAPSEKLQASEGEQAYATNIDTFGTRLLLLAMPGLRETLVCQGTTDESRGLVRFSASDMSRKAFREFFKELRGQVRQSEASSLVGLEPTHCRWLFEEAYQRSVEAGTLIPESYKSLRYRLKPPDGYDPSEFINSKFPVGEDDIRSVSAKLEEIFSIPEVTMWLAEKEALLPYASRYVEMAESKLVLDDQQRRHRLQDAISDFAAEYFDKRRLHAMVRRLEETAYLVSEQGRADEAGLLAALARDVAGSSFLQPHKFLISLMLRSVAGTIQALNQEEEARRSGGGRIIRPDQTQSLK